MDIEKIKQLREENIDPKSSQYTQIQFSYLPRIPNPDNQMIKSGPPHKLFLLKSNETNENLVCLQYHGDKFGKVLDEEKLRELEKKYSYNTELNTLITSGIASVQKSILENSVNSSTHSSKSQKI
jgi:hypothetical protein